MLDDYKEKLAANGEVTMQIKARAGAHATRVKSMLADGTLKIDIAQVAEAGKANEILIDFLATEFAVPKENIKVLMGKFSGDKTVKIVK